MIKVGITGGIGSGKSLICQVFSKLKVPVFYADEAGRVLSETDPEIRQCLISLLGSAIYTGQLLNRPLMSEIIFNNKSLLEKVNQIIHTRVTACFNEWCANHAQYPYVIEESAILFESNLYKAFDKIITVTSPEEIRIQRVISRKNMTLEKIKSILKNQLPEQERLVLSQHVIINDGNILLLPQVLQLHKTFITQAW
jgi:dephospho-CoA kinase